MIPESKTRSLSLALTSLALASSTAFTQAPVSFKPRIPPAPYLTLWPEITFLPERQCHGDYRVEDLQRYLPKARVAMWLPGTQSVTLDQASRCLVVRTEGIGAGRLAELALRGVEVPRRAVLLLWM